MQAFRDISDAKADKRMIDIALKIIEQKEGPFEPTNSWTVMRTFKAN